MGPNSGDRPVSCRWGDGSDFTLEEVIELRALYGAGKPFWAGAVFLWKSIIYQDRLDTNA
jgi:hypothetical protein